MAIICQPIDYLGINYYTRTVYQSDGNGWFDSFYVIVYKGSIFRPVCFPEAQSLFGEGLYFGDDHWAVLAVGKVSEHLTGDLDWGVVVIFGNEN